MKPFYPALLSVISCSLFPVLAFGVWQPNGDALSMAPLTQRTPAIISDGNGGAIVAWSDYRNGTDYNIYAQRIDASGAVLWTVDGVALCTAAIDQVSPTLVSDGAGGAIVTWTDQEPIGPIAASEIVHSVYVQRVDASGTVLWGPNGTAIATIAQYQWGVVLLEDGAGGAIVAWSDQRGEYNTDVFAQRINASGTPLWATDGVALCTATYGQTPAAIVSDGAGGAIVAWSDFRQNPSLPPDIYAQRVDASGVLHWPADGVALCNAPYDQGNLRLIPDGEGGAFAAWSDMRTFIDFDIYVQHVDASGSSQWTTNGVNICAATKYQYCYGIVPDGAGGVIVTWEDYRNGANYDVYAQRVDGSGAAQWTANGVILCTPTGGQNYPAIATDGAGGAIVTWQNVLNGADIYGQRIDPSGALLWGAGGLALCTAANNQYEPSMIPDGAGGAIVTWHDIRGWGTTYEDIYAMRISANGSTPTAVNPAMPPLSMLVRDNYPNPFSTGTVFHVTLPREASVTLEVFDAAGRRVRTLNPGTLPVGASRISFDGRDDLARALPSGVYFCRLQALGETATRKMVIAR